MGARRHFVSGKLVCSVQSHQAGFDSFAHLHDELAWSTDRNGLQCQFLVLTNHPFWKEISIYTFAVFGGFHPALDWHILHGLCACIKESTFPYFFPTGFLGFSYWAGARQSMPLDYKQSLYISRVEIRTIRKHGCQAPFCERRACLLGPVSPSWFWFFRSLPCWACVVNWLKRGCR